MIHGPVFRSELLMTSRRRRYYAARLAYGLLLLYVLLQRFSEWEPNAMATPLGGVGDDHPSSLKQMALFAESTFVAFATLQGISLLGLVPALLAGVIADERQRKTLPCLLDTHLSSAEIVLGKLAARLLHAAVIVAMGIPVVALVGLFGGLDPWEVGFVYAGTLAMTSFVAGLSMLVSVVAKTPRRAILAAYVLVACWIFVPLLLESVSPYLRACGLWWVDRLNQDLVLVNPLQAWRAVTDVATHHQWATFYPRQWGRTPAVTDDVVSRFALMAGLQMASGLVLLLLAIAGLRPFQGGGGRWERRRTAWFPTFRSWAARGRPPCGDDPMLWKESYLARAGLLGWMMSPPVIAVIASHTVAYYTLTSLQAFGEFWGRSSGVLSEPNMHRAALNLSLRSLTTTLDVFLLVVVASASAVGVTAEREGDSWISLNATLLTGREIVRGKVLGALRSGRRVVWLLAALWAAGLVTGAVHPLGVLAAGLGLLVGTRFAATLGVFVSLRAKNSVRALAWTFTSLAVLGGGYLVLFLTRLNDSELPLIGAIPHVEWLSLFSYDEVDSFYDDLVFILAGEPGRRVGERLLVVMTSLVLYSVASWILLRASYARYERVVDRPARPG